jgi:hypothetical protein
VYTFVVTVYPAADPFNRTHITTTKTALTLTGLVAHQEHRVVITATAYPNANARGAACNASTSDVFVVALPEAVPLAPPTNVSIVQMTDTDITITWQPPALHQRGGRIVLFRVVYQRTEGQARADPSRSGAELSAELGVASTTSVYSLTLASLEPAVAYRVRVCAATALGCGPYSAHITGVTGEAGL